MNSTNVERHEHWNYHTGGSAGSASIVAEEEGGWAGSGNPEWPDDDRIVRLAEAVMQRDEDVPADEKPYELDRCSYELTEHRQSGDVTRETNLYISPTDRADEVIVSVSLHEVSPTDRPTLGPDGRGDPITLAGVRTMSENLPDTGGWRMWPVEARREINAIIRDTTESEPDPNGYIGGMLMPARAEAQRLLEGIAKVRNTARPGYERGTCVIAHGDTDNRYGTMLEMEWRKGENAVHHKRSGGRIFTKEQLATELPKWLQTLAAEGKTTHERTATRKKAAGKGNER